MIAKVFTFVALAATTVLAIENSCNTGPVQCCNQLQNKDSKKVTTVAGILGIVIGDITGQVGLTCNPIDVIAIGGNSCSTQPVCCEKNNFNGLVNLGCTPVNVNL